MYHSEKQMCTDEWRVLFCCCLYHILQSAIIILEIHYNSLSFFPTEYIADPILCNSLNFVTGPFEG